MFSLQFPRIFASRLARPLTMLAITALAAPGAALANSSWTSVGSTGDVDEACYASVRLNSYEARLAPGTTSASCTLRYQVVDTFGLSPARPGNLTLNARILDNGLLARVVVSLLSYNIATGATTIVESMNSDSPPPSPGPADAAGFRSYATTRCLTLDFVRNSYWIEVGLVRRPSPTPTVQGTPAIALVNLGGCLI